MRYTTTLHLPEDIEVDYYNTLNMSHWDNDDGTFIIPITRGGTVRAYHKCGDKKDVGHIKAKEVSCTTCDYKFKMSLNVLTMAIKLYYF